MAHLGGADAPLLVPAVHLHLLRPHADRLLPPERRVGDCLSRKRKRTTH